MDLTGKREAVCVAPEPQLPGPPKGWGALRGVVMAWPRSGTQWLCNVFVALGVDCGHELYFASGSRCHLPRQRTVVDVSGFVAPFTDALAPEIGRALIVRHPQQLFGSILKRWKFHEEADAYEWIGERWVAVMDHLSRGATAWWRIEDVWARPETAVEILGAIGVEPARTETRWDEVRRGTTTPWTIPPERVSDTVWAFAARFGYRPMEVSNANQQ
jgi:hypothetical protein